MIDFFSSWTKTLGLSIVIVSILEMLLPNNKTKKYVRMVMGIYILFTIISPFISNKEIFNINNIDFDNYMTTQTSSSLSNSSVDNRIEQLYISELEKDITKKINQQGFEVENCEVDAQISDEEDKTKITKIKIKVDKSEENGQIQEENLENQIVIQIQKIKPIETEIKNKNSQNQENLQGKTSKKITQSDIQNIKKFLIEEYGVNEKCLEIN